MIEADLEEFLRGVLAVSAYKEQRSLPYGTGVFDLALAETVKALQKQLTRERVQLQFRLRRDALAGTTSQLSLTLRRLEREGWLSLEPETLRLSLSGTTAYAYLAVQPLPINVLERAAKTLWRRLQVARLRNRFATTGRPRA